MHLSHGLRARGIEVQALEMRFIWSSVGSSMVGRIRNGKDE